MSRVVVWATTAQDDLNEIARYLGQNVPDYADSIFERLVAAGERLGVALTGHPGRVAGYYEKSVPDVRYIIAYSKNVFRLFFVIEISDDDVFVFIKNQFCRYGYIDPSFCRETNYFR